MSNANELQVFNNDMFGQLRTIEENGKTYFCGNDVASALGYRKPNDAVSRHCPHTVKRGIGVSTGYKPDGTSIIQTIEMSFIPEGDVYRLIIRSKLPTAEKFEHWVFDEVLPSINHYGLYATDNLINNPDLAIAAFQALKEEREQRKRLEEKVKFQQPLVEFAQTVQSTEDNILVRECSKLASNYIGIDIGEKKLYQKLREWRMVLKDKNEPSKLAYKQGILVYIERAGYKNGRAYLSHTTKVTPKGQVYIINKLINEYKRMDIA